MKPKAYFKLRLAKEMRALEKEFPSGYASGLKLSANIQWNMLAKPMQEEWEALKKSDKKALEGIKTPKSLLKAFQKPNPLDYRARKRHKAVTGSPNCDAYATKLKARMETLSKRDAVYYEDGKRPISAFAKAEMDLRHEEQLRKLDALRKRGYKYCWLSTHADCSDRCAPWQGKLVDINGRSSLPSFRMGFKKDGYEVYALQSIIDQVDAYGYKNNILVGFNCRHHLIPYHKGSVPPKRFSKRVMSEERAVNANLRAMEREIRATKRKSAMYNEFDGKTSLALAKKAEELTKAYKKYAMENGYEWHAYRLEA